MRFPPSWFAVLFFIAISECSQALPVINELMFHPAGTVENPAEEWVELYNASATDSTDLSGWKFSKGVQYTFPAGTVIGPGSYLVIAADLAVFQAKYPGVNAIGGWTGQLSSSGETLQLDDNLGRKISRVTYADEGDWATRARGPLSFSHKGWVWLNDADGGGSSLELVNPALDLSNGQNWKPSVALGGTPGAINSRASVDTAPLISAAQHRPMIPKSTEPIVFSCAVEDELPDPQVRLFWRVDGTAPFATVTMADSDGDGRLDASIPAQPNGTIIEWYLSASDGTNVRTWPAPARTTDQGVTPAVFAQVTNALLQVDDSYDPNLDFTVAGNQPVYRLLMTKAERTELENVGSVNGQQQSVAEMNGTFISQDGTGMIVIYSAGIRNRGFGSALGPPNNYHVSFRSDSKWNGRSSMPINCRYPHSQAIGNASFELAGIPPQEAAIVQVRVNGSNLAETGARMYGRYVRLENRGGDWVTRHYPSDPDGNFYRLDDHAPGTVGVPAGNLGSGEFRYEGTSAAAYSDTFVKETNQDANDYSDLIELTKVVSAPLTGGSAAQPAIADADYPTAIAKIIDLDQWYRYFATDALVGNQEGGLGSGRADDVSMYRGIVDPRFRLIPHDLDDVFDIGAEVGNPITRSIFSYDGTTPGTGVVGLTRLFNHRELVPRYYSAVLNALDTWFNHQTLDPVIDQIMGGWVPATGGLTTPATSIAQIKAYIDSRRANILSQIQQNYSLTATTAATSPEGYAQTNDGSATFAGTFNVAKTYSVTVNGKLAQWFYRTAGTDAAGTWKYVAAAGGGGILSPGLNRVTVTFWDGVNGTGNVLQTLSSTVFYNAPTTSVSGILRPPGSVELVAPATYVPGSPVVVRLNLRDSAGLLDRQAWTRTATLTANNGVTLTPNTVTLYNGVGSATVLVGSSGSGGGTTSLVPFLSSGWRYLDDASNQGTAWKEENFVDTAWKIGTAELGYGDGDEATVVGFVDLDPATAGNQVNATTYFRKTFNVTDPAAFTSLAVTLKYDDGGVVYLNGQEIGRTTNVPANQTNNTYTTGNTTENASITFTVANPAAILHAGVNTLAVEIHQHDSGSADISMDCRIIGNLAIANPGNFTLTANVSGLTTQKSFSSLAGVTANVVSGTLSGDTTWNGVVRVTGDITVPTGTTLTIDPGTHVLFDGDNVAGSTAGRKMTVNGALLVNGTAASPVNMTAANNADRWGQLSFANAQPSTLNYLFLSHAGHATGVGHTGRGPMIRLSSSHLTANDSVLADGPAKALYSSGACDVVMSRTLINRMITGPELEDGASLLIEDCNIQEILPIYRESNAAAPDDEDCLYVHNSPGRPVTIRRCVFARCGDDAFDCLGGPMTVEDSILREAWDKGMSLLNNDLTISRTQIIDCDKAIVPKSNAAVTRTITVDRCTIVAEDHDQSQSAWGYTVPPSNPDPDTPSTGLYTQNKAGQSNTGATIAITATNCLIVAKEPIKVDAPYDPANTVVSYSDLVDVDDSAATPWVGLGNFTADPLFSSAASKDFRLQATSPCIDAGVPTSVDPDGSRADVGALAFDKSAATTGVVTWTAAGGPYRITDHLTVPTGLTLLIQAGTSVWVDQDKSITVNGTLKVAGTEANHVVFSHPPGTVATGDADPIVPGIQTGAPKWAGLRIVGPGSPSPMSTGHEVRYADFINAQPVVAAGNQGSLGIIRAEALVDHCTFAGTHLRQLYGKNCSLTVQSCIFPDQFDPADPNDNPVALGLDNIAEPLKVEMPDASASLNPELVGNPNYVLGLPVGGHWRVYYTHFYGNKGHNDVFDADSGRWGQTQILDCRYNWFHGLTGDEHIDLGGDAYIASNTFERGAKDQWTSDHGYANAISSGDKGSGTTIWVVRNTAFDLDHVMNCKVRTGTIFEHNTVANLHADFHYSAGPPYDIEQDVKCSAINLFIPDDTAPTAGDGAYAAYNIFHNIPRVISWADLPATPTPTTSKLEVFNNYLNSVADLSVGSQHPGGLLSLGTGNVQPGDPGFRAPATKDFQLKVESAARGTAPGGFDYGATIPEWAYISSGPTSVSSASTATFTVGGPGVVAFKWRLDGGAWSAPVQIGSGGVFPRTGATVRTAFVALSGVADGAHLFEVLGQDAAGNWQDADPAKTVQSSPTGYRWTVKTSGKTVRINEVLADSTTLPDQLELFNSGAAEVDLSGWSLLDSGSASTRLAFPAGTRLAAGAYLVVTPGTAFQIDKSGETITLSDNSVPRVVVDSVTFGQQVTNLSIGRLGSLGDWGLCVPTLGAANTAQRLGDRSALRINEWFASGIARYDYDWVELSNSSALPVALQGIRLTDNAEGNTNNHVFGPLSFIGPNGFLKLIADGDTAAGANHLPFSLDAQLEHLVLFDGTAQLDQVLFYPQSTDISMGRDASGGYLYYQLPTAGLANASTDPAYVNALNLLRFLRITEIMYNPPGGNDYEFIELKNIGPDALDLAGVKFVSGIDYTFSTLTLSGGGSVVVVANLPKFRERYGAVPRVAGQYVGKLENAGEPVALQLPPPFDANVLTFSYSDAWQDSANGHGKSLVVGNPALSAGAWGDGSTWSYSASPWGDPDGVFIAPPDHLNAWLGFQGLASASGDVDGDGASTLIEYALGMNPNLTADGDGLAGLPELQVSADGHLQLHFDLPENPGAVSQAGTADLEYVVEASDDLLNWSTVARKTFASVWTGSAEVTVGIPSAHLVPVTVKDVAGPSGTRFLRLRATVKP